VNSPSAGQQWIKGERYKVTWSASGGVSKVDVSISHDGGATWELLADDMDAAPGTLQVKAKKPKVEDLYLAVGVIETVLDLAGEFCDTDFKIVLPDGDRVLLGCEIKLIGGQHVLLGCELSTHSL
jgi:hypothetical protein